MYYRLLTSVATFLNSTFLCSLSKHFSVKKTSNIFYKISVFHSHFKLKYFIYIFSIGKRHPILILTRIDPPVNRDPSSVDFVYGILDLEITNVITFGWGSRLTMEFTGNFVYMAHHFIVLWLNPFILRVDRKRWWFEHSVS